MVNLKEEAAMAEPKPAAAFKNDVPSSHKQRYRNHTAHQSHYQHTHIPYYNHVSYPSENHDVNGTNSSRATSPAKFNFGPGFEPQSQIPNAYGARPSQAQNGSEYVVFFHVNPGVIISFQMGDNFEILRGPVTVPMVSTNSSPPIAMPVQVPPGHVVQQIVDESGTLRHVILSAQHPAGLMPLSSHNHQHYGGGPANGNSQNQQNFYPPGIPSGYPPPHFHSNIPPGHPAHVTSTHSGHSPPPNPGYYKDERTQQRYIKLKRKLHDKQMKNDSGHNTPTLSPKKEHLNGIQRGIMKEKGVNSVGTSEDGDENSSTQDEEDYVQTITDILSSVQAPKVSELSSRSALLQWAVPPRLSEASNIDGQELDICESDLLYEVLLSDKSKEMKYKLIYSGASLSCRIQDLRPGQEYSVCLLVHLEEFQGSVTDPIKFTTPSCEPDQPSIPKLISRTKNTLQLRWNSTVDNGSHILYYVLECDEGKGGDYFIELLKSRGKQHNLAKLNPATVYQFRLAAVNEKGKSIYSDIVTYATSDVQPEQPTAPTLRETSITALHLTWQKRPKDDEFVLQMEDPKTRFGYLVVYNGTDTEYVCENLRRFTEYKFRLKAQNESGPSPWSEEVTFRTLPDRPARPTKPVVKGRIHAHSFRLKWEPPFDAGGSAITTYILELNSGSGYKTIYTGCDTEAVCDKLTPGTTYQLRVSCTSSGGRSNYSDPCTVTTDAISPGSCTEFCLHGKPKPNSITVRWCEPDYNGGAPVLEYEVEMVGPDDSRNLVHKSKETECTVTMIKPGCQYSFTVRAVNRIGPGPWTDQLVTISGATPPEAPSIPIATCKSPFHALLEWKEPHCNGAPVVEYRLEMSHNNVDDQFLSVFQGNSTSYDVKCLSPFTTYYFRVQACNAAGYGNFSSVAATITPAAPPSVVSSIYCDRTPTSITLRWNEPANNGSLITHYNIEIGDKTLTTEESVLTYTIEHLNPLTTYRIKIQAVNQVGAGAYSSIVKTTTLALPPSPPPIECIGVSHNFLKLKWGEGKNHDFTQYCVEMENNRTKEFQCVYQGTAFTCKVNKLQELSTYRFRIYASNDAGEGDYSEEYHFKTTIAPPAGIKAPKAVEIEHNGCTLEWIPSKNVVADPIIYLVQICRLKDQDFKQVYKGPDTKCNVDNLEPGGEYCARICPIRLASTGELPGPHSPQVIFTTAAVETLAVCKPSTAVVNSHPTVHRNRNYLHLIWPGFVRSKTSPDQQLIMIVAVCVMAFGILIAMVVASLVID